jgi:hypothetical protein
MALNPSGAISLAGPSTGQSIAVELGVSATATISLNDTNVRTLAQVASGVIVMPTDFWGKSNITTTQKAIFGGGGTPTRIATSNLVSSSGVVASDTPGAPGVGARVQYGAASYGGDKAIFGFGIITPTVTNSNNLISNTGVIAADTSGAGTARSTLAAAGYGNDKAIFAFGGASLTVSNLVSNTGVVSSDTPGAPGVTARNYGSGATYGGDKAIFVFGNIGPIYQTTLGLVSNTGVIAASTPSVATARVDGAGAGYGGDKAIFGFGRKPPTAPVLLSVTNLVSNTGVIASDTPGVGTARHSLAAAGYGGDKAIFGFGSTTTPGITITAITNLVSNTGVVATNTPGVGTARHSLAAAGYSTSA